MTNEDVAIIGGLDQLVALVQSGWYPADETRDAIARVNAAVALAERNRPQPAPEPERA